MTGGSSNLAVCPESYRHGCRDLAIFREQHTARAVERGRGPLVAPPHTVQKALNEIDHAGSSLQLMDRGANLAAGVVTYFNILGKHRREFRRVAGVDRRMKRG
jgi:hypothetical protein